MNRKSKSSSKDEVNKKGRMSEKERKKERKKEKSHNLAWEWGFNKSV